MTGGHHMHDIVLLVLSLVAGCALGGVFFQGLWWTIRRAVASRAPAAWFLLSLVLRTLVVVIGFILISHGSLRRLVACLAGFFVARCVVGWRVHAHPPAPPVPPATSNAPAMATGA
jgi:F1F0 ATPase subunit 2